MIPYGISIVVSEHALKETQERLFPVSAHRSARIHKKLIKRFGGEFRTVPAAWRFADRIVMHPVIHAQLMAGDRYLTRALS